MQFFGWINWFCQICSYKKQTLVALDYKVWCRKSDEKNLSFIVQILMKWIFWKIFFLMSFALWTVHFLWGFPTVRWRLSAAMEDKSPNDVMNFVYLKQLLYHSSGTWNEIPSLPYELKSKFFKETKRICTVNPKFGVGGILKNYNQYSRSKLCWYIEYNEL